MRLERRYRSSSEAERIWRSVAVDNPAFLRGGVRGTRLVIEIEGERAGSLRQTLDDLLACIGVAERSGSRAARDGRASSRPPVPPN